MAFRLTDIELIHEVLHDSNARAFETLMMRYTSQVYGAALRLVKDEENAQEVTQMAFIQAYRQLDSWRGENFGAWVTIIANHIALRLLEKEKRRYTEPLSENADPPDETYDEKKEQRLQSLEAQTIAQRLRQTENNIKVRMCRIRERLKKVLTSTPTNL